ncbi:MAG: hypothetical protein N2322_02845 [Terrimicrobiaceae bacterium]|nr:hypothetical protein [Terrimicrobiaceae bacterium]
MKTLLSMFAVLALALGSALAAKGPNCAKCCKDKPCKECCGDKCAECCK